MVTLKWELSCTAYFLYCNTTIDDAIKIFSISLVHNGDVKIDYFGPFSQFRTVFFSPVFVAIVNEVDIKKEDFLH